MILYFSQILLKTNLKQLHLWNWSRNWFLKIWKTRCKEIFVYQPSDKCSESKLLSSLNCLNSKRFPFFSNFSNRQTMFHSPIFFFQRVVQLTAAILEKMRTFYFHQKKNFDSATCQILVLDAFVVWPIVLFWK